MRDVTLEDTFYINFTTRAITGVPTQLAGTPALSVLEENNATPITAGVSVSVDRASVTGLNQATIVATAANGYEAGKGYCVYISTGTVNSVSAVGEVVGEFTIQAQPVNWAKVTGATTAVDLSGTDIQLADTVTTLTNLPAITSNWLTAAGIAASALDGKGDWNIGKTGYSLTATTGLGNQTADITGNVSGSVGSVTAGVSLAAGAVTDASLAGNMEIVFETDFATNYNTTRNAWATNAQDFVGTSAADPFNGQVVAADVTAGVDLATSQGAITFTSLTSTGTFTISDGLDISRTTSNQPAIKAIGDGSGDGILAGGGSTGSGIKAYGEGALHGLELFGGAAGGSGLHTAGQGAGDGITAVAGGSGVDITADITGNLSGSVGSVTGHTNQTGDTYALANGAAGFVAIDTVVDAILAMLDDARAEPGQGAPAVNPDAMTKIDYLYKAWRNRSTQTATQYSLYADDATTIDQKATVSDDGTTADKGEVATGP